MSVDVDTLRWTTPRSRAFVILAKRHPEPARRSNDTNQDVGYIYWQTADWLVEVGLAKLGTGVLYAEIRLTTAGERHARQLGLLPTEVPA